MIRILILYMEIFHLILSGRTCKSYLFHATMSEHLINIPFLMAATLTFRHKKTTQVSCSISIFCTTKNVLNCSNSEKRLLSKSLKYNQRYIRLEKARLSGLRSMRNRSRMRLLGSNLGNKSKKTSLALVHKN